MADPAVVAERQQAQSRSLILSLITLPFHGFGALCGSLLVSILIECLGVHFFWPDQGWRHAQSMLTYELEQVSRDFTRSVVVHEPARTAQWLVESTYDWIFVESGLGERLRETSTRSAATTSRTFRNLRDYIDYAYPHVENYVLAAVYTLLVFLVRLLVLCLTLPLFVMAAIVGFVDGLVRRDIRRFGAGRESGFIYHRAKATLVPLLVLPWVVYLALPVSVSPLLILLPSAVLLGLAVNIATSSFKKYL
jgi:integrating conjugative element membrane protein (TIGR03747 family)